MRDSDLIRLAAIAAENLDRVDVQLGDRLAAMRLQQNDGLAAQDCSAVTVHGGDPTSVTERAGIGAALGHDHAGADLRRVTALVVVIHRAVDELTSTLSRYTPADPRQLALEGLERTPAGKGDCLRCGQHCPAVAEHRLKSGYCPTCHRTWLRLGRPDRSRYNRDTAEACPQEVGDTDVQVSA